jgi:hypothetical protein
MPEQWEIELQQIRQLQRNEVANHNRIRERVVHLRDLYYSGLVDPDDIGWDKWAIDRFANSPENLRRMMNDHPNSIDRYARTQQRRNEEMARHQQRLEDEERRQRQAAELKALKVKAAKAKERAKPKPRPLTPEQVPPHQLMLPLIEGAGVVERKTQVELGAVYVKAKQLVDTHQVGGDPRTGKPWLWTQYGPIYFGFNRVWIYKCIKAYEAHVASGNTDAEENVVPLRGGK